MSTARAVDMGGNDSRAAMHVERVAGDETGDAHRAVRLGEILDDREDADVEPARAHVAAARPDRCSRAESLSSCCWRLVARGVEPGQDGPRAERLDDSCRARSPARSDARRAPVRRSAQAVDRSARPDGRQCRRARACGANGGARLILLAALSALPGGDGRIDQRRAGIRGPRRARPAPARTPSPRRSGKSEAPTGPRCHERRASRLERWRAECPVVVDRVGIGSVRVSLGRPDDRRPSTSRRANAPTRRMDRGGRDPPA